MDSNTSGRNDLGKDVVVKNIEVVEVNAKAAATLTMTNFTGVNTITSVGSTAALTFDKVQDIPAVALNATSSDVTVNMAPGTVVGLADTVNLTLNTVATSASNTVTLNGVEKVNVSAVGAVGGSSANGTDFRTAIVSSELESITVTGSAAARLAASFVGASLNAEVAVFDASTATGAINASITIGASGKLSATGGSGNDTLIVGPVTKDMTVAGGAGTDTLVGSASYSSTATTQAGANVTGFEVAAANGGTVDQRAFTNNTFVAGYGDGTYGKMAATFASLTTEATATVSVTRGTASTTDALTVNLNGVTADTLTLVADDEEALTFNSAGAVPGVQHTVALTSAAVTKIVVTGSNALDLGVIGATSTALATVDASANTGSTFSVNAASSTANMTITGSAGRESSANATVNTITTGTGNDKITGGAYKDVIVGGQGADTIDGGAGNDVLDGGTGADSILGGAGNDTISGDTGNDYIDGGDGDDQINAGTGTDTVLGGAGNDQIAVSLSDSTSVDGGAGTDRVAATSGTITSSSATSVNGAFIAVAEDAAPKLTSVETLYASITGAATDKGLDLTGASSLTSLFLETAAVATKVTNYAGSAVRLYGATTGAAEATTLLLDGVGQSSLTVGLEAYSGPTDLTVTGVGALTLEGRSTSQFTGNADQANAVDAVVATAASSLTIRTTGSAAANVNALLVGDVTATAATAVTLSAGAKDTLTLTKVDALGGGVETLSVAVAADAAIKAAAINLTGSSLTTATIDVAAGGVLSTAAAGAVDVNAAKASTLNVTLAAGAAANLDLTGIEVTAGTISVDSAGKLDLVGSLGLAAKASSFTFSGRGDVDFATPLTLVGSSVTFNSTGLTIDADSFDVTGTAGADSISTNLGNDDIDGGAGNDTISTGVGNDIATGGTGADSISVGTGTDTVVIAALAETGAGITADGTLTLVDVVSGMGAGDKIDLTALVTGGITGLASVGATADGVAYLSGTSGNAALIQGTYTASTGAWAASATGADLLFVYDTNGVTAGGLEAIVLTGANSGIATVSSSAAGLFTFG